ncbi:MAG: hypothetical protein IPG79_18155 [Saprospiraceae bacterium]|nr:hypothetical protein [Saprospiraceae bacterium]
MAGSVLLLKSISISGCKRIKTAIYHSCTDLGVEGEDNTFGMGIINVYVAYLYLIAQGTYLSTRIKPMMLFYWK